MQSSWLIPALALATAAACSSGALADRAAGPDLSQPPAAPPPPATPIPAGLRSLRVAFVVGDRLIAMDGDGSGQTELAAGDFADLAVSPNGREIAFTRAGNVFVMNADATNVRQLTVAGGRDPAWSADGARLAFVGADEAIYTMLADGSNGRRLTNPDASTEERDYAPAWSPDGTRLVFTRFQWGEFTVLWTVNADGTNATLLGRREPFGTSVRTWASWAPVWTRLTNRIVFAGPSSSFTPAVFDMRADGSGAAELYSDAAGSGMFQVHDASADGQWILITKVPGEAMYVLKPGFAPVRLTREAGAHSPAFLRTVELSVGNR